MIEIEFKDRIVEFPRRYAVTDNGDGTKTLTPFPGEITEEGTPVNAANLNKLKDGIFQAAPVGAVMHFARTTAPDGWLECNGQAVSRTTYADLFAVIGTTFGVGNGSTTFNLPDLRGEFIRGWDNGRNVDPGRTFGSFQEATSIAGRRDADLIIKDADGENGAGQVRFIGWGSSDPEQPYYKVRPRNIALLACIKY